MSSDKKFKSLATTNEPIEMSISDIVDIIKDELQNNIKVLDRGTAESILNADDDLLDMILADYDSQLLWNLINTQIGTGILIGLLIGSITQYFEDLKRAENEDDEDYGNESNEKDNKNKQSH
jgi:hypothetical protein